MVTVGGHAELELIQGQLYVVETIRHVVDHAHRGVRETEFLGQHALGGDGHPYDVTDGSQEADLGRGLEPGTGRLYIDATVDDRCRRRIAPSIANPRSPRCIEAGDRVAPRIVVARCRGPGREEVIGQNHRAHGPVAPETPGGSDREHAVTTEMVECGQVAGVAHLVGGSGRFGAVAGEHDQAAAVAHRDRFVARANLPVVAVGSQVAHRNAAAGDDSESAGSHRPNSGTPFRNRARTSR